MRHAAIALFCSLAIIASVYGLQTFVGSAQATPIEILQDGYDGELVIMQFTGYDKEKDEIRCMPKKLMCEKGKILKVEDVDLKKP